MIGPQKVALKAYISEALELATSRQPVDTSSDYPALADLVGARFENLRWFELPKESLDTNKLIFNTL